MKLKPANLKMSFFYLIIIKILDYGRHNLCKVYNQL